MFFSSNVSSSIFASTNNGSHTSQISIEIRFCLSYSEFFPTIVSIFLSFSHEIEVK